MAKNNDNKQKFGDIVENHDLIKRTLMVAAYPALVKAVKKEEDTLYEGFLPGFDFAVLEDIASEDECVEYLQDMLDDEVEQLIVVGKSLPNIEEDDKLLKKYPGFKIVYLDVNVYATKEELKYYDDCIHDCTSCSGSCKEQGYFDACEDDECECHSYHFGYDIDNCDCDDACDCCGDDACDCGCHDHFNCDCDDEACDCDDTSCNCDSDNHDCCCDNSGDNKNHKCNHKNGNLVCDCHNDKSHSHKQKGECCGKGKGSCKNDKSKQKSTDNKAGKK